MSELHEALKTLHPRDISDVLPIEKEGDDATEKIINEQLEAFMRDVFQKAELIASSVPPPPGGEAFGTPGCKCSRTEVNDATGAADMTVSSARPAPPPKEQAELQKLWGKPLKLKNNPLDISVFKMAAKDRYGAWFARHSVHEGLGFTKWKRGMQREFSESLAVHGGPGEGSIRGIGGDRRLEERVIEGVGKLEVYQLSMGFPPPTSPREFVTLLLTSEAPVSDANCPPNESDSTSSNSTVAKPRQYIVVSIPVTHPEAELRKGSIRGQYESIEVIREIPIKSSNPSSLTIAAPTSVNNDQDSSGCETDEAELNPVEWIMVTRSDPGGGIPRFLVERNTPASIVGDASKFLDWACATAILDEEKEGGVELKGETGEEVIQDDSGSILTVPTRTDMPRRFSAQASNGYLAGVGKSIVDQRPMPSNEGGIISSLTSGIASYAPKLFHDTAPESFQSLSALDDHLDSSTETSSIDSFASAEQFTTAIEGVGPVPESSSSADTLSLKSSQLSQDLSLPQGGAPTQLTRQERELEKIQQKQRVLEERIAKRRESDLRQSRELADREQKQVERAKQKHEREMRKREEKYKREVEKLEKKREKALRKDAIKRLEREKNEWQKRSETLEKENHLLKDQVGDLQREVTALVAKIGKLDGGKDALSLVREELQGSIKRGNSTGSSGSSGSRKSKQDGTSSSNSGIGNSNSNDFGEGQGVEGDTISQEEISLEKRNDIAA